MDEQWWEARLTKLEHTILGQRSQGLTVIVVVVISLCVAMVGLGIWSITLQYRKSVQERDLHLSACITVAMVEQRVDDHDYAAVDQIAAQCKQEIFG